jgi:hypothetical protein
MSNLKVAWNCEVLEYRDFKLVASGISVALKELQELAACSNEYVGKIGDRIDVEINSVKALYTKYNIYGDSIVYKIIDTQGHTYIYSTDRDMSEVSKMKATVKAHEEYKGVKQTVITRATILAKKEQPKQEEVESKPKPKPVSDQEHQDFLKEFFGALDSVC